MPAARDDQQPGKPPVAPDRFERRLDFRALVALTRVYVKAYHGLVTHAPCPVPPTGPALVAANHTAGLDPLLVQSACPRPIVWMMTSEFYDLPHMRWFFAWTEMIRIDRTGRDARAWRAAMRHLKAGHVVGVFPEGRIERHGSLLPFQTGVALLAKRGGADLYPVYLDGLQRNQPMLATFFGARHPSLAWGAPVRVGRCNAGRDDLETLTAALQGRVESLRREYPSPRQRGRSPLALRPLSPRETVARPRAR